MAVTPEMIQRINELARKSRREELTEEEKQEQKELREAYLAGFRRNMAATLDQIVLVEPDGSKRVLKPKKKGEKV